MVNFYNDLDRSLGRRGRPRVKSIRYASPGAIEIAAIAGVALSIRHIVEEFVKSGEKLNSLYNKIRRGMIQRKLLSLEVREKKIRISEQEFEFARKSFIELSEAMSLPGGERLLEAAPDSVMGLKVLLSLYRRVRKLGEFEIRGKAKL